MYIKKKKHNSTTQITKPQQPCIYSPLSLIKELKKLQKNKNKFKGIKEGLRTEGNLFSFFLL